MNDQVKILDQYQDYPKYQLLEYKGYKIQVEYDHNPINPFEDWDGLMPCIVSYDGYYRYYQGADEFENSLPELTKEQIIENLPEILRIFNCSNKFELLRNLDVSLYSDAVECINENLKHYHYYSDGSLKFISKILTMAEIDNHIETLDNYTVALFIATDSFLEQVNLEIYDFEKELTSAVRLLDDYNSNNVFGYTILSDEEDFFSCWGFYGDDFEENGLFDYALPEIDYLIKQREKEAAEELYWLNRGVITVKP